MAEPIRHDFKPGEVIFQEGEKGFIAYVIEDGRVDIVKTTPEGERVLATVGRGEVIGEMALIDGAPRSATARAQTAVTCLVVSGAAFRQLVDSLEPLPRRLLQKFVAIARNAQGGAAQKPPPQHGYHGRPLPGTFRKK